MSKEQQIIDENNKSFVDTLKDTPIGDMVQETVENLIDQNIKFPLTYKIFAKGEKPYYICLNHRGRIERLFTNNHIVPGASQKNNGIHIQIQSADGKNRDQFTTPLPTKNHPSIVNCLGMIVFFDEEDLGRFRTQFNGRQLQEIIPELAYGGKVGEDSKYTRGIHTTLFNLSDNDYYTVTPFGVTKIPHVDYKDVVMRFDPDVQQMIENCYKQGEDPIIQLVKKSDFQSNDDILFEKYDLDQSNKVRAVVIGVSKESRLANRPIMRESNGLTWRIYPSKELAEDFYKFHRGNIEEEISYFYFQAFDEERKEMEKEFDKKKSSRDKKTFNFLIQVAMGYFGKGALEKVGEHIKKYFAKKAKEAAAKTAEKVAEKVVEEAVKNTVWETIKSVASNIAKAVVSSIAVKGITSLLTSLFKKAVACFV